MAFGAGLNEVEASEPVYLDEAGGIGMFGVSYTAECIPATATEPGIFRWDDMAYIEKRIKEIKAKCRWCVVVAHGGGEFTSLPSPYTRDRYLKYLELGADVVVGHHPHVPENYELFDDGKAIFYSLGNFIFDTNYQQVAPKKISVPKTQEPQRFLGFFVPFFKVEFKRYHFLKTAIGEDLNYRPRLSGQILGNFSQDLPLFSFPDL